MTNFPAQPARERSQAVRDLPVTRIVSFSDGRLPKINGVECDVLITIEMSTESLPVIRIDGGRVVFPTIIFRDGVTMARDNGLLDSGRERRL